jgi:tetratricopeptide (TPR) repeat protein
MRNKSSKAGVVTTLFLFWVGCAGVFPLPAHAAQSPQNSVASAGGGSYYHFMLARRYEELAGIYGSDHYADLAVSQFQKAIADDPHSLYLHVQLGDMYSEMRRDADAEAQAQWVLKLQPNYAPAHRLLGDVYLHSLGQTASQGTAKANLEKAIHQYALFAQLDPQDTKSAILLGRLYQLNGQPEQAAQTFKKVLSADPNSAGALGYLARLQFDQRQFTEAEQTLEKIPPAQRGSEAAAMLGLAYMESGEYDKAAQNLKSALAMNPVDPRVRGEFAEALLRSGKNEQARNQFAEVIKTDPKDGQAYLRLAQIDQSAGQFQQATQELNTAKKLLPGDDLEVAYTDSQLQVALGHSDESIKTLQGLLARTATPNGKYSEDQREDRSIFLDQLAGIYRNKQDYSQAIATYQQMEALGGKKDPPRAEARIAETLQMEGKIRPALDEAAAGLKKYPQNQSLNILYATLLGSEGHVDKAVDKLKDYMKVGGGSLQTQWAIVEIYSQGHRYRDAETVAEQLLDQNLGKSDREYTQVLLADVYDRQKKYALAEQQYRAVLASNPHNAEAYNDLGYMLADRGVNLPQSVSYIKHALKLQPNNGAYLDSLGWAYYKMSRYDLARPPLERAARLMANDPTVLMHLGNVYLKLGDKQQAAQTWSRALQNYPSALDTDFGSAQAGKLKKRLNRLERQLSRNK